VKRRDVCQNLAKVLVIRFLELVFDRNLECLASGTNGVADNVNEEIASRSFGCERLGIDGER